jgi:hypothetical protein
LVFHRLPFCYSEHNYMKLSLIIGILKQLSTNYIYMVTIWWWRISQMTALDTRSRGWIAGNHNIKCNNFRRIIENNWVFQIITGWFTKKRTIIVPTYGHTSAWSNRNAE